MFRASWKQMQGSNETTKWICSISGRRSTTAPVAALPSDSAYRSSSYSWGNVDRQKWMSLLPNLLLLRGDWQLWFPSGMHGGRSDPMVQSSPSQCNVNTPTNWGTPVGLDNPQMSMHNQGFPPDMFVTFCHFNQAFGSWSLHQISKTWGFPSMGVSPIAVWFIRENLNLKWMMTRGPHGNPQILLISGWLA